MKKQCNYVFYMTSILCLFSTQIAYFVANLHETTDQLLVCNVTNYAWSIRFFCLIVVLFACNKRGEKNENNS